MRMLPGLVLATTLTSACAPAASERPACPREVEYGKPFLAKLAAETEALPAGSALGTAMADYGRLRDQSRACRGERIPR